MEIKNNAANFDFRAFKHFNVACDYANDDMPAKVVPSKEVPFWAMPADELMAELATSPEGLGQKVAEKRIKEVGPNEIRPKEHYGDIKLFGEQFKSPIILILIFAAGLSYFLGDSTDATIILVIVLVSGALGFWQERGARNAIQALLAMVQITASVLRDGKQVELPTSELVPGDIISLAAGDIVPADSRLLQAHDLFVNTSALTGESYPVEKFVGLSKPEAPIAKRNNSVFMGTHVISGSANAVVVTTGKATIFGKISEGLRLRPPETEFERGVRRLGYLLMEMTFILVFAIFAINVALARPVLQAFLFALALAVGLTPQLLPAIITINLAHGARSMAEKKVIVKRLVSIENFGSMNVLCSDKTGTLTKGIVELQHIEDINGNESKKAEIYTYLNALYETGYRNPIDDAIRKYGKERNIDVSEFKKIDELPYDFNRKMLSILVSRAHARELMITKGATKAVLAICTSCEADGNVIDISLAREMILSKFKALSSNGIRTLAIAYKEVNAGIPLTAEMESGMTFLGFIELYDPPKEDAFQALERLSRLGVTLKLVTGDNELVARYISDQVGLRSPYVITGGEMNKMPDEALIRAVSDVNIFAEVEPNQKERLILALKKVGNVVGYLGDGINDAGALHAADVGISVNSAVDVAKEAADIVLTEKDLSVLAQGIKEGRKTFANTMKYVFMATSGNFGNMFTIAGSSIFIPFLPLLPTQVLLLNLLSDVSESSIATDSVDVDFIMTPKRWNLDFIRKFLIVFGPLSSIFDALTFVVLLFVLHSQIAEFRAGWFIESAVTASLIILVIRTKHHFFRSRPSFFMLMDILAIVAVTFIIPYTVVGAIFHFAPVPPTFIPFLVLIILAYMLSAELVKLIFYKYVAF